MGHTDILPIVTVTLLKRYFEMFYLVFFWLAHTRVKYTLWSLVTEKQDFGRMSLVCSTQLLHHNNSKTGSVDSDPIGKPNRQQFWTLEAISVDILKKHTSPKLWVTWAPKKLNETKQNQEKIDGSKELHHNVEREIVVFQVMHVWKGRTIQERLGWIWIMKSWLEWGTAPVNPCFVAIHSCLEPHCSNLRPMCWFIP